MIDLKLSKTDLHQCCFRSYQLWDMSDCPSGQYKINHECESIAVDPCENIDLVSSKVLFINSGCQRSPGVEIKRQSSYDYRNAHEWDRVSDILGDGQIRDTGHIRRHFLNEKLRMLTFN